MSMVSAELPESLAETFLTRLAHLENRCDSYHRLFITLFSVMMAGIAALFPYLQKTTGWTVTTIAIVLILLGAVIGVVWASILENLTLQRKATWKMLGRLGEDYDKQIQDVIREYRKKWSALTPSRFIAVKKGRPIEHRVIALIVIVYIAVIIMSLVLTVKGGETSADGTAANLVSSDSTVSYG